jgi:coenzyme F420 hydrogenase subunit delta
MGDDEFVPECYRKPILVLGCGNVLFGDDGFGPAVIEYLKKNTQLPEDVAVIDAGTGVREILFTLTLSERKPKKIIIVDAVDTSGLRRPGEIVELSIEELPENKIDDFSIHQLPTSNLLRELEQECKVQVVIIAAQVESIPNIVKPGLSKSLVNSIPKACQKIQEVIEN